MIDQPIQCRVADWIQDKDALKSIRHRVFVEEQKVPVELEWDEYDETATHFIVTLSGQAIACARLKSDGQIGRMAVLTGYRNQGIGQELLRFVLRTAAEKDINEVYLHAQVSAIPFYEKQGFISVGEIFYEADIPHREMLKKIC
ncbi:MAG: GNAT family N-acetyltransferase [Gammaproteobacteria bacterium]|nr:GNAT family N-acetyltransferase [Gammaproteobacteria bacterium]MBT8135157.1 GNAT family N-acetyltransferase [Gammaproteobacteria bacterium]NNJ49185.1 GNAT family N-acetyltransferase [Gammaproteobacteria bacterium]